MCIGMRTLDKDKVRSAVGMGSPRRLLAASCPYSCMSRVGKVDFGMRIWLRGLTMSIGGTGSGCGGA